MLYRRPYLTLLAMAALATTTTACGRIAVPSTPAAPAAEAGRQPMPKDLPAAVAAARAAMKDPGAQPLMIGAYGVMANGKLADSVRSGWVLGMKPSRGEGAKLVGLFWNGDARVAPAKPQTGAQPAPLMPTVLPPLKQSVAWARAAGLPQAATYAAVYLADPEGPAVAVTELTALGGDPLEDRSKEDDRKVVILDPSTGKALLPPVKAPEPEAAPAETPAAAPEQAEAPEATATLAAFMTGVRRGR